MRLVQLARGSPTTHTYTRHTGGGRVKGWRAGGGVPAGGGGGGLAALAGAAGGGEAFVRREDARRTCATQTTAQHGPRQQQSLARARNTALDGGTGDAPAVVRVPAVGRVAVLVREAPGRMAVPPTRPGSCFSRFACGIAACARAGRSCLVSRRVCVLRVLVVKTAASPRSMSAPRSVRRGRPVGEGRVLADERHCGPPRGRPRGREGRRRAACPSRSARHLGSASGGTAHWSNPSLSPPACVFAREHTYRI
jgi:hypothetical protein